MPSARGSARHCEEVDEHGAELVNLLDVIERVTRDGFVDADERALLKTATVRARDTYAPLPGTASQQDGVLRWIAVVSHTGRVTPWVERVTRETIEDEERVAA